MNLFVRKNLVKILISSFFLILLGGIFFIFQLSSEWSFENIQSEEKLSSEIIINEDSITTTTTTTTIITTTTITTEFTEPSFEILLSATELYQGDTLMITAKNVPEGEKITGKFNGKSFNFFPIKSKEKWIALLGIDAKKAPGEYSLSVSLSDKLKNEETIIVKKSDFFITKIVITPELEEKDLTSSNISNTIATEDGVIIYEVLVKYHPTAYFNQDFIYPLDEIINVGAFGNIRKDGDITIQHLGVDLDAIEGTPIYAINSGKVVLVEKLTVYGDTIIIDHGLGIYSLYLHLSEFKVTEGEMVERGQLIGLVGNTGWSLGSHLHLSVKVDGASVDPLKFIETITNF